jgi:hypothetical protein
MHGSQVVRANGSGGVAASSVISPHFMGQDKMDLLIRQCIFCSLSTNSNLFYSLCSE